MRWVIGALVGLVLLAMLAVAAVSHYGRTPGPGGPAPVVLTIEPGTPLPQIARQLGCAGVIRHPWGFRLLARTLRVDTAIKAGEYRFAVPVSPRQVLATLVAGSVLTHAVTIPEGSTVRDIAVALAAAGICAAAPIEQLCGDPAFVARLDARGPSLEGYLFPETYRFARCTAPQAVLTQMVAHCREIIAQERQAAGTDAGPDEHTLLTLASIVEKETGRDDERPLVAAVLHNRLRRGMRLECDPTVLYGIRLEERDFGGRLRRRHLDSASAYNTYRIAGLPPGPICSPGRLSIRAVLQPAAVNYLYFVSRNDGTHLFSATLQQHNRAVRRYQKRRR